LGGACPVRRSFTAISFDAEVNVRKVAVGVAGDGVAVLSNLITSNMCPHPSVRATSVSVANIE
jgi:hypothetical protein